MGTEVSTYSYSNIIQKTVVVSLRLRRSGCTCRILHMIKVLRKEVPYCMKLTEEGGQTRRSGVTPNATVG